MQFYSDKRRETDKWSLPDCSLMWFVLTEAETGDCLTEELQETTEDKGWYWCFCLPSCLPDSEWYGPYKTAEAAIADCRSEYGEPYSEEEEEE